MEVVIGLISLIPALPHRSGRAACSADVPSLRGRRRWLLLECTSPWSCPDIPARDVIRSLPFLRDHSACLAQISFCEDCSTAQLLPDRTCGSVPCLCHDALVDQPCVTCCQTQGETERPAVWLQTLQPQGFQLLCSGHSWENYEAEYQHVLLHVHRELRELEGLGMREQVEQQLQQRFLERWLVAEWEGGLAANPLSPFLSDCCLGTFHCPPSLCKIEVLCGGTRLMVPLYRCPVGLGDVSSIQCCPLVLSLLITFSPF
ncbi:uncharacterized protein LOC127012730 [Gymnogyps californianus]|uniref:uncharacterized protein LOC127012730 n=1 Tax=Gymnogyps californianus TaxID=33616 RepID=UPI0021C6CAC5|nr:uncharacterized protein LOC127012730 [Gymnogyps californianus]